MSRWLIPLFVAALFLAGAIGVYVSAPLGLHYTAAGAVTGFIVTAVLVFILSKFIVVPLDALIDREAEAKKP